MGVCSKLTRQPCKKLDRITPLFPLELRNILSAMSDIDDAAVLVCELINSLQLLRVRYMFVPVSPSGTGEHIYLI